MTPVRLGFIGVGGIGGAHLRIASNQGEQMAPVAVCDANADIAKRVGSEYGLETHMDYRELCSRGDLDAVVMALPHYLYGDAVCCALENGLHVFKEKPFAHSLADAQRMVDKAKDAGRQLMTAGQSKFAAPFIKGKEIADGGSLGDIYLTRAAIIYRWGGAAANQWGWRGEHALSGGVAVVDAGWHMLDMVHWYRGMPCAVYASLGAMKGVPDNTYDVDDKAVLTLEYPDGGIACVVSCYITTPPERRITLHGTRGSLDVDGENVTLHLDGESQPLEIPEQGPEPMTAQLCHFVECVRSGVESPIAGPQRAYEVMQIVDAAYRSADGGARMDLG